MCIHLIVCKHKPDYDVKECSLENICKFVSDSALPSIPFKKRKYKKRDKRRLPLSPEKATGASGTSLKHGRGRGRGDYQHLTTSDKDIRRAKNVLNIRKVRGSLSENQVAALEMYRKTKLKDLAEHQRKQILDILNDVQKA